MEDLESSFALNFHGKECEDEISDEITTLSNHILKPFFMSLWRLFQ